MAKAPQERYGTRLAGWFGIFVTTAVAGPAACRLSDNVVSWPNVILAVGWPVPAGLLDGPGGSAGTGVQEPRRER